MRAATVFRPAVFATPGAAFFKGVFRAEGFATAAFRGAAFFAAAFAAAAGFFAAGADFFAPPAAGFFAPAAAGFFAPAAGFFAPARRGLLRAATAVVFFVPRALPGVGADASRAPAFFLLLAIGGQYTTRRARSTRALPCRSPGRGACRGRTRFMSSRMRCSTSISRTRYFACCSGVSRASRASRFFRVCAGPSTSRAFTCFSRSSTAVSLAPPWRRRRRISRTMRLRSRMYARRSPCSLFTRGIAFANCASSRPRLSWRLLMT